MKEKFKLLKLALKEWHQRHSQNLPAKIETIKNKVSFFDLKGESSVLLDEEVEELHVLYEELFSLSRINTSICWQQSRVQWLREGDANSKKIPSIMSSRRRGNSVSSFLVNGVLIEGLIMFVVLCFLIFLINTKLGELSAPAWWIFISIHYLIGRLIVW